MGKIIVSLLIMYFNAIQNTTELHVSTYFFLIQAITFIIRRIWSCLLKNLLKHDRGVKYEEIDVSVETFRYFDNRTEM